MRTPQAIVVRKNSLENRKEIDGCPVWRWSEIDGAAFGGPTVVVDAIPGDYIVWHEPYTERGSVRRIPWSVVPARPRRRRPVVFGRGGRHAEVAIGCGAVSRHRTVEAAIAAAKALLRGDEQHRADMARRECERNEPTECPDGNGCRHGIDS